MKRFIEAEDRTQVTLLPECLDDFIAEDNSVRVVDAFVEELGQEVGRGSSMPPMRQPGWIRARRVGGGRTAGRDTGLPSSGA